MEKCYENLLKYFVFLCNLIFALAGACLVGFGAYVQVLDNILKPGFDFEMLRFSLDLSLVLG